MSTFLVSILLMVFGFVASVDPYVILTGQLSSTVNSFNVSAILLASVAVFRPGWQKENLPIRWLLFTGFLLLHTILCYGFFNQYLLWVPIGSEAQKPFGEPGIVTITRSLVLLLASLSLLAALRSKREVAILVASYGAGVVFSAVVISSVLEDLPGARLIGSYSDPNVLSLAATTSAFLMLWLRAQSTSRQLRLGATATAVVSLYAVLASGSRAGVLSIAVGVVVFVATSFRSAKERLRAVALIFVIGVGAVFLTPTTVWDMLAARTELADIQETRGSRRLDIWEGYLGEVRSYWAVGTGIGRAAEITQQSNMRSYDTHNAYLAVFVETGVIGAMLLLAMVFGTSRALWLETKTMRSQSNAALAATWCAWLVHSFFMDSLTTRQSWIVIVAIFATQMRFRDAPILDRRQTEVRYRQTVQDRQGVPPSRRFA